MNKRQKIILGIILILSLFTVVYGYTLIYQQYFKGTIQPTAEISGLNKELNLGNIPIAKEGQVVWGVISWFEPFILKVNQPCKLKITIENANTLKQYLWDFEVLYNITEWNKEYKVTLDNPSIIITFQNVGTYHIKWGYTNPPYAKSTNQKIQIDITVDYQVEPL